MKVLFTYNYKDEAFEAVKALGYEVDYWHEKDMANYPSKREVDILICYNPFDHIDLRDFNRLKFILLSSIGFDQLPLDLVKEMAITVCNNRGGYSIPMGEWIVMRMLEFSKHTRQIYENQNNKRWHMDTSIEEIFNKRVLFMGTGTIAKEGAKRLQGFDMTVVGLNTDGKSVEFFDECYPMSEALLELKKSDFNVLALPLTKATRGLVDASYFDAMKTESYLINVARGEITDEEALISALTNNKIRGAALDVFHEEPLKENHPLWEIPSVIISCHNSWISEKRNERRFDTIYENLKRIMFNQTLINVIDLERGY
jgi:phosphoglycerate dehydrogenase-like enzyme